MGLYQDKLKMFGENGMAADRSAELTDSTGKTAGRGGGSAAKTRLTGAAKSGGLTDSTGKMAGSCSGAVRCSGEAPHCTS